MSEQPFDFDRDPDPPYAFVDVDGEASHPLPEALARQVLVQTIHDGGVLPARFRFERNGEPRVDPEALERHHVTVRDWGASLVAEELARALGLGGFGKVRIARALFDFNRFPGSTSPGVENPMEMLAIGPPFAAVLDHGLKMEILEGFYDGISDRMETLVRAPRLIIITIHTYDVHTPGMTKRPDLSLINCPRAIMQDGIMPFGLFDPLYPSSLIESTCSRILHDRISLNLERSGFRVSHNFPYPLPEGSLEIRMQVWFFFDYLRRAFQADFPRTVPEPSYQMVWTMLLNTNLRLAQAELLRGYLHRYRRVPDSQRQRFDDAQQAYEHVKRYLVESPVIQDYRRSPDRPSSLGIEVRKDLVCHFDASGQPQARSAKVVGTARKIARVFAGAITNYFETDRPKP